MLDRLDQDDLIAGPLAGPLAGASSDLEVHRGMYAQLFHRGHARIADTARHNARIVRQVRLHIERDAMKTHPLAHAHAVTAFHFVDDR